MRKIDKMFSEYAESHQNQTNKLIHWICVPLIFWSILGFISLIPAPHIFILYFGAISVVSILTIIAVSVFYFRLSWRIAIIMFFIMLLLEHFIYFVNVTFEQKSWIVFLSVFILSWIGQFYGHKIEGKKSSFLKDLQFLLVGPIWLLSFVLKKFGLKY
ncbi:Mpo1 family 2-hydroxy fatty acid dioxygenase [Chryseobacterium sp. MP_3.2]|uniref:Mpo1 family 2-hydroxy fatty acid dioxygenase n=1 Tax=Chryseobacterium sp. MP_3.2 TaxID=3071712 RepID=UPI002E068A91|nr:putative membrane protein YGL010W [Chryseobacterium sp. MP_3.2]